MPITNCNPDSYEDVMSFTLTTPNLEPNLQHGQVGVKVAQLAKQQQEVQGEIALELIAAATPPKPEGNKGHHIDIRV